MDQQPSRQAVAFPLMKLPAEMLDQVLTFLPEESEVALMLTSKEVYNKLGSKKLLALRNNPIAKGQLLRLLEKDMPHMIHCACCNKLWHWSGNFQHWQGELRCTNLKCRNHGMQTLESRHQNESMMSTCHCEGAFMGRGPERILVLLRHLHGAKHGHALRWLRHRCVDKSFMRATRSYEGKIIGEQILMHTTITFEVSKKVRLAEEMAKWGHLVCSHANYHAAAIAHWCYRGGNSCKQNCHQLMKCFSCETDFTVHVRRLRQKQVKISFNVWQNLGGRPLLMGERLPEPILYPDDEYDLWDEGSMKRHEVVLARDLEQTFKTGSWVERPLPSQESVADATDCVAQTWGYGNE